MRRGSTMVRVDPYAVGVGLHGSKRLAGLGIDSYSPTTPGIRTYPGDPGYGVGAGSGSGSAAGGGSGGGSYDYGTEARRLALTRQVQDAANRAQDQMDAAQQAAERERVLQIAQEAVTKAEKAQVNILTAGQNQFRRLLFSGSIIAALSLVAVTVVSMTGTRKKSRRSGRSKNRSRSGRHRRTRRRIKTKVMSFSEKVGS